MIACPSDGRLERSLAPFCSKYGPMALASHMHQSERAHMYVSRGGAERDGERERIPSRRYPVNAEPEVGL